MLRGCATREKKKESQPGTKHRTIVRSRRHGAPRNRPLGDATCARSLEFLEATSDVDYDAKLVSRGGKMRFANEDYESKSANWKLAYRAGREATEKARAFASVWFAELD